jgi:Fe-Mn family superoxide dismutase
MLKYEMPQLDYGFSDLEPYIDARTMEIHYSKHHQTYLDKLNLALESYPSLGEQEIDQLIKNIKMLPVPLQLVVKNMGGGFYNHNLFWRMMAGPGSEMPEKIKNMLDENFGTVEKFREEFSAKATGLFGSGWTWLVQNPDKKLEIITTQNQDNPLSNRPDLKLLLNLDVWEHAYYLKYQNKRAEYVQNWWNVVNWQYVLEQI